MPRPPVRPDTVRSGTLQPVARAAQASGDSPITAPDPSPIDVAMVIRSVARPSLRTTLRSLVEAAPSASLRITEVVVVDDRIPKDASSITDIDALAIWGRRLFEDTLDATGRPMLAGTPIDIVRTRGVGRSGALDIGVSNTTATWVITLDEDVTVPPEFWGRLAGEIAGELAGELAGEIDADANTSGRRIATEHGPTRRTDLAARSATGRTDAPSQPHVRHARAGIARPARPVPAVWLSAVWVTVVVAIAARRISVRTSPSV